MTHPSKPPYAAFGDLTSEEQSSIQEIVDRIEVQTNLRIDLYVVGSTVRGERRGVGRKDLPIGKVHGKSDIDYIITEEDSKALRRFAFIHNLSEDQSPITLLKRLPDIGPEGIQVLPHPDLSQPTLQFKAGVEPIRRDRTNIPRHY